jgi:MoxR-like ATPase
MKSIKNALSYLPRDPFKVIVRRESGVPDSDASREVVAHVFDELSIAAVNGALAAQRPLLVKGEPGVGKTQLAAAVASKLVRPFVPFTVNARTEPADLLWRFDAVQRLAEAQICGTGRVDSVASTTRLEEWRFVEPGPLWWGFDWNGAIEHKRRKHQPLDAQASGANPSKFNANDHIPDHLGNPINGVVVLIDEIDKADPDLPNGLLEALGSRRFVPAAKGCSPVVAGNPPPLVVITTNQERILPDAFLRRCLILTLKAPGLDELVTRGRAHFPEANESVLRSAAEQLMDDRQQSAPPLPGLAEYLDLLRALFALQPIQKRNAEELLKELSTFTLHKHRRGVT